MLHQYIFDHYRAKQPQREVAFPRFDEVRSVLILFESDLIERNDTIKAIAQDLAQYDKDVVLWGYCPKKEITSPILPQLRIVGTKDYNIFGVPKQQLIADLQKRQYDLLIDLTQHQSLPLAYLAMYAKAHFKTGMAIQTGIHDLLISTPPQDTPLFLYQQIVKYLNMIKPC